MKRIVIICNGGFGREMQTYVQDAFPDNSHYRLDRVQDLFPDDPFTAMPDEVFTVANGDPAVKAALVKKIEAAGGKLISVIHPTCYVAKTAFVGEGAILCPFAFVGPYSHLAPHVTMNVHTGCGHNGFIDSFAVLSPYASIAGASHVGKKVFLGSYAFVAPAVRVGDEAKLNAGAFAVSDIPAKCLAAGNPARVFPEFFSPRAGT